MQTHLGNGDDETAIDCPVPGCEWADESAAAVCAHVGSAHADGWDEATREPADIHEEHTANDCGASYRAAKVMAYLERNDVPVGKLRVYEHGSYGSIQVVTPDGPAALGDGWPAFERAVVDREEFQYIGDGVSFLRRSDVEELPPVPVADECEVPECDRDADLSVTYDERGAVTLCRPHLKEAMGVSS
jgi:hypothetical protein